MASLEGRVCLVTGGGRGIGRAVARRLGQKGARVVVLARSSAEVDAVASELRNNGVDALSLSRDVTDPEAMLLAIEEIRTSFGAIEVLVNNAGIVTPLGSFVTIDYDEWARAVEVNLLAPTRLSHVLLPSMLERGFGRIVNVTSAAVRSPEAGDTFNAYISTKSALETHSVNLGAELASSGVTVNAFRPGPVDTEMQTYIRDQPAEVIGKAFSERFVRRHAEGGLIQPEVPAALLVEVLESDRTAEIVSVV